MERRAFEIINRNYKRNSRSFCRHSSGTTSRDNIERGARETHQKLAAAEALLRPVRRHGKIGHDRRGEASPRLMVTLVRPVHHPLGRVRGHVALVQLGRPYLLLPLRRRLTDGPMLGEPRDPLGLHPVVIRPRLPGDRLQ